MAATQSLGKIGISASYWPSQAMPLHQVPVSAMIAKAQILAPLLVQGEKMAASGGRMWGVTGVREGFSVCYIENYAKHEYEIRKQTHTIIIRVLGGRGPMICFKA